MRDKQAAKTFPPNEALEAFTPFIGAWKTVGTHGMIPDTTLHGRTTFSWHESGAFILVESSIEEDVGIPVGLAIIGSDNTLGTYTMVYYDQRGVSRHIQVSLEGNVMKCWRDGPEFSQRNTLTISDDKQTIIGKGEIAKDGSRWEQDLNLTYSKVLTED